MTDNRKAFARALEFATIAHLGQKRSNGDAYIIHPIRVSQEVFTELQKVVALLHDTLEDTNVVYEELKDLFGIDVAETVRVLTRLPGEEYMDYIARVKTNPDAVKVKLADIADNLNDSPDSKAIKKSAAALTLLLS